MDEVLVIVGITHLALEKGREGVQNTQVGNCFSKLLML